MARTKRFSVTDYSKPGAGVSLGQVRAFDWNEAANKAAVKWPGRQLSVSTYG